MINQTARGAIALVLGISTSFAVAQSSHKDTAPNPPTGNQDSSQQQTQQINTQDTQSGNDLSARKKDSGAGGDTDPSSTGQIKQQDSDTGNNLYANAKDGKNGAEFDKMSGSTSGTMSREQAMKNPWLKKNFSRCDADGDGSISRNEYATCRSGK